MLTTCSHRAKPVLLDAPVKFTQNLHCDAINFRDPSEALSFYDTDERAAIDRCQMTPVLIDNASLGKISN
jgi:hypothetical protein